MSLDVFYDKYFIMMSDGINCSYIINNRLKIICSSYIFVITYDNNIIYDRLSEFEISNFLRHTFQPTKYTHRRNIIVIILVID